MRWLIGLFFSVVANIAGLVLTAYYTPDFVLSGDLQKIAIVAVTLTVLNILLKPILRLFLGPIIILTLGLGLILVNGFILYILDILSENLTILSVSALFWGALIIGILNFIVNLAKK